MIYSFYPPRTFRITPRMVLKKSWVHPPTLSFLFWSKKNPAHAGFSIFLATLQLALQRNSAYRAGTGTSTTFNAFRGINHSFAVRFANRRDRASRFTSTTVDAYFRVYFISHSFVSYYLAKFTLKLYKKISCYCSSDGIIPLPKRGSNGTI